MFVNKGKKHSSGSLFSMLHHHESTEKPQYKMATPISRNLPSPIPHFALPPPPLLAKILRPPIFIERGGGGGGGGGWNYDNIIFFSLHVNVITCVTLSVLQTPFSSHLYHDVL